MFRMSLGHSNYRGGAHEKCERRAFERFNKDLGVHALNATAGLGDSV